MEAGTSFDFKSTLETSMTENSESIIIKESLDFSSPWHFTDVVLVVEDIKFHVHKCILSMWSPVFQTMFTSQFKESNAKEIPLPGKRADEVEVLLKFIYSSGTRPPVTEKNYQFLVQLADEYQMDRVKKLCSEFLVNMIKESNCLKFFKFAERYGLEDVTEKCFQEVCYNSSADLESSESFSEFEPEFKVDICMRIIKELERTLQEYVMTCSELAQQVYKKVYENFYRNISQPRIAATASVGFQFGGIVNTGLYKDSKEHIRKHKELQLHLKRLLAEAKLARGNKSFDSKNYNTRDFKFSCNLCVQRVQQIEWNDSDSYTILKEPLNKLYALQKNNKVARKLKKAKEMAEQTD